MKEVDWFNSHELVIYEVALHDSKPGGAPSTGVTFYRNLFLPPNLFEQLRTVAEL